MSATHFQPGASAVKSRSSRSAGRTAAGPGTVVRGFFRLADTVAMPISRISRSTVHLASFLPVFPYPPDLFLQVLIPFPAPTPALTFLRRVIRERREFQHSARRLDSEPVPV